MTVHAIFENGVFKPTMPVALPERCEVEFDPRVVAARPGSPDTPDPTWNAWLAKLESLRSLQDGWNSYTAPAPAAASIENARLFLEAMRASGRQPDRLAPSAMGGVAVTRKHGDKKVLVEFYNDGRAFALFSASGVEMRVVPVNFAAGSLPAFLDEMQEYLHGSRLKPFLPRPEPRAGGACPTGPARSPNHSAIGD